MPQISLIQTEGFDKCESEHPLWKQSGELLSRWPALEQRFNLIVDDIPKTERAMLCYIYSSLADGQEYDAGNAILCVTQQGLLSHESVRTIASTIIDHPVVFRSLIGNSCLTQICRSLGAYFLHLQDQETASKLWSRGVIATLKSGRYRKRLISDWKACLSRQSALPSSLHQIIADFG